MAGKLQAQTAATTLDPNDIMYAVRDPGGTPVDRKITIQNLISVLTSLAEVISTKTANYTLVATDTFVQGDCSSSSLTFTLPDPTTVTGKQFKIKKIDTSNHWLLVTVPSGTDGAVNYYLATKDQEITVESNGTLYKIIGSYKSGMNASPAFVPQIRPQPSLILTEFQSGHGYTGNATGTFTLNDTADFIKGTQAVKIVTNGAGGTSNLSKTGATPVSIANKQIRITLKADDVSHLNRISLFLGDTAFTNYYKWFVQTETATTNYMQSGEYISIVLGFHDAMITGSPSKLNITDVRVQVSDDNSSNPVTVHVQGIELIPNASQVFPNGVVSIVWDDSYESPYTLARPRLDLYGYTATVFTIADYIDTSSRLTLTQLKQLQDISGWEVSGHAFTDANHVITETGMSEDDLDNELRNMKDWLSYNGFKGNGIAYPQGKYSIATLNHVKKYFNYGRTILYENKETFPAGDNYRLRSITGVSSLATAGDPALPSNITKVGGQLDLCQANNGWLILTFHNIVTSSPGTTSDCLQSDFNAIIDAINSRGMACMSVADVLKTRQVAAPTTTSSEWAVPMIHEYNDFVTTQAAPGWANNSNGTSAAWSSIGSWGSGTTSRGVIRGNLGTTATGRVGFGSVTSSGLVVYLGEGNILHAARIQFPNLSDGTNTYTYRSGIISSYSAEPTNGCYFRYTDSVNSGKFQCVTRAGGVETATDSGITVAAATTYKLEVLINEARTQVIFKINGVIVATNTTNIPAAASGMFYAVAVIRSVGTSSFDAIDIDYQEYIELFTTPR